MISDRKQYEPILQRLVGRTCHRTISCNSIKLRFEATANTTGRGYIWIDPPWSFMHHQRLITALGLCPNHEDADYTLKFREWCSLFSPLNQTILTEFEFSLDGDLKLLFPDSYSLHIPVINTEPEDAEDWYLHWYARRIEVRSQIL